MTLTPLDIHNKEFKVGFRGYVEAEVDDFLDQVVKEFEALIRENGELKDRLDDLDQALERYRTIEDSLNKTLLLAQKAAEEVRTAGEKEVEVLRERARMEAKRVMDEAKVQARQAVEDYTEMRREAELFRLRMKTMLQAQLEIFEQAEAKEEESGTTPFAIGPKAAGIAARHSLEERDGSRGADRETGRLGRASPPRDESEEAAASDGRRLPPETGEVHRPNLWGEPVASPRSLPSRRAAQGAMDQRRAEADPEEESDRGW